MCPAKSCGFFNWGQRGEWIPEDNWLCLPQEVTRNRVRLFSKRGNQHVHLLTTIQCIKRVSSDVFEGHGRVRGERLRSIV